jgi:hypothetical protein
LSSSKDSLRSRDATRHYAQQSPKLQDNAADKVASDLQMRDRTGTPTL